MRNEDGCIVMQDGGSTVWIVDESGGCLGECDSRDGVADEAVAEVKSSDD